LGDLRAYLLEEAHEAAAALDSRDWRSISEELGDLLFQIAFILRLGEEENATTLAAVIEGIETKMIARHPHVFGDSEAGDAEAVRRAWETRKAGASESSHLAGVPTSLPALVAAYRMTQKVAGVGFDWADVGDVTEKLREEIAELEAELERSPRNQERIEDEIGDTLFTAANLSRHLGHDPEAALAQANRKFRRRFERLEQLLVAEGGRLDRCETAELESLWQRVKQEEAADG